ncbi:MAG: hypothetical protein QME52_01760 [Bacteroidota bacterium]|nr:hypothetical protein [Bacteroidota bacterium]
MPIDQQILTEPGVHLAIVALIIEVTIATSISRQYDKARNSLLSSQHFQSLLQKAINDASGTVHDNVMVTELIDLMGTQRSTESIRIVLRKNFISPNERIRHLANMGPAVGLFFTFTGMFLTVLKISTIPFGTNVDILSQNFSNLFPVFIGGAVGIAVYAYGMVLFNRIQTAQYAVENDLLKAFLVFESTHEPPEPRTVEDAYKRLLKPLKLLLNRLELINTEFEKLSNQTDSLITKFSEKTNNFIEKIDNKTSELTSKFKSNFDALETGSKSIAGLNSIFTESAKQWKESSAALSSLSQTLLQTEDRLQKLATISETVSDLVKSLDSNTNNINKLVNWVEQDRLEFSSLKDEMKKFGDTVPAFTNTVEQFRLGLNPLKEIFDSKLSEIKNKLEEILNSPSPPIDFQKDVTKYLKEINISLDKISKDGQARKVPTLGNPVANPNRLTIRRTFLQKVKALFSRT